MAATGVDFREAFELEERLLAGAAEDDLHKVPPYWSGYVRRWLDSCLPADACERCNGRLHISVTELTRKLEMWFAARGSRNIFKLIQPLRMANHTFKTGVAVGYHKQYNDDL